jgi:hypothetical protein
MSSEYYIFCSEKYQEIILKLEDIIDSYELLIDYTNSEENLDINHCKFFQPENNSQFFIDRLNYIKQLKNLCDNQIKKLCNHEFEDDFIDITPDKSCKISYCTICEYTK